MIIKTKFSPNDKIWLVFKTKFEPVLCSECNRTKRYKHTWKYYRGTIISVESTRGGCIYSRTRKRVAHDRYGIWTPGYAVEKDSDTTIDSRRHMVLLKPRMTHNGNHYIFKNKKDAQAKLRELKEKE